MRLDIETAAQRLLDSLHFPIHLVAVWAWTESDPPRLIVRLDKSVWRFRESVPSNFMRYDVEVQERTTLLAANN